MKRNADADLKKVSSGKKYSGPARDDTGAISPYRARLKERASEGNVADAEFSAGRAPFSAQRRQIEARAQLTEIHSRSKKKDGGKRG